MPCFLRFATAFFARSARYEALDAGFLMTLKSYEIFAVLAYSAGSMIPIPNLFGQISFNALIATDSKNHAAQWSGDDGTRTISWNIDLIAFDDPNIPGSQFKTIETFLNQYPDINDAHIWITAQAGTGTTQAGNARFYFDQILLVPEPSTLVLLGLAVPALVMIRRRKV